MATNAKKAAAAKNVKAARNATKRTGASPARTPAAKKPAAKKPAAKKPAAKKPAAKKPAAKKPAAKKPAAKKPPAKKAAASKPAKRAAATEKRAKRPSFEQVWEYREETLYPRLFGAAEDCIYTLEPADFAAFDAPRCDPRWLHLGVMEFPPTPKRASWLYVTSGGSTPWDTKPKDYDPDDYSWLGVELVIETPARDVWPIRLLRRMLAFHVLAEHGHFGDRPGVDYGMRAAIGATIDGSQTSPIRFMAVGKPKHYPATAQLPSGKFDFLHIVGITEAERDRAKEIGTPKLLAMLAEQGAWPVTDPQRKQIAL